MTTESDSFEIELARHAIEAKANRIIDLQHGKLKTAEARRAIEIMNENRELREILDLFTF